MQSDRGHIHWWIRIGSWLLLAVPAWFIEPWLVVPAVALVEIAWIAGLQWSWRINAPTKLLDFASERQFVVFIRFVPGPDLARRVGLRVRRDAGDHGGCEATISQQRIATAGRLVTQGGAVR
jgi:hypothetical protein